MAGRLPLNNEESSRMKILIAAIQAFSQKGYDGTSIRDISKVCGLHQPTIYHFFKNKENLFWVALRSTYLRTMRILSQNIVRNKGLKQELLSVFNSMEELTKDNPEPAYLLFRLVFSAPPVIRDRHLEKHGEGFRNLIEGAFERHKPVKSAAFKSSMVHQSRLLDLSTPVTQNRDAPNYAKVIDFILNAKK